MDPEAQDEAESSAVLFDFLSVFLRDLERGERRELDEYMARFPGCEEALRREYSARTDGSAPAAELEPRSIGPYRLLRELGRGGQGVVYSAQDTRIDRRVALKLLPASSLLFSEAKRGRLRREAEVVSRLNHPGICGIYDADISGDFAYIAMPIIEGVTLAAAIASAREGDSQANAHLPLAPKSRAELHQLLHFFEDCARALHVAHEAGVVHRDIKPGNLMVTPDGRGVWLDFGQALDTESATLALTMSGEVFGTPAYMSPEQVAGDAQRVDARTDVWALGVSLFEALTLQRAFHGSSTHTLLNAVQEEAPPSVCALQPQLPRDVDVVLRTALEKDLTRRYTSALELADELARIRRSEPILARPAGPALRLRRWAQRSPVLFATVSGALVALSLALVWTLYLLAREERALDFALGRHLGERAVALLDEDPSASLVLAIEAVERAPSYLTRSALYAALERCNLARELDGAPALRFRDIAMMGDGRYVAAALSDGTARLYNLETGAESQRWAAHAGDANWVHTMGDLVLTGGAGSSVNVQDTSTGENVLHLDGLEVDPKFSRFYWKPAGIPEPFLHVSDGESVDLLRMPEGKSYRNVFLGPDQYPFGAESFKLNDLLIERVFEPPNFPFTHMGPRGLGVMAAGFNPGEGIVYADLSPDGTLLAVALESGVVNLYEVPNGEPRGRLEGYLKPSKVLFSADGQYLVTHSKGAQARVWYATNRPDVYRLHCGEGAVERATFSADGERALTISKDGMARVWATPSNAQHLREVGRLLSEAPLNSPQAQNGDFEEFDLDGGLGPSTRGVLSELAGDVRQHRLTPDGKCVATVQHDGSLRLWNASSGEPLWQSNFVTPEGKPVLIVDFDMHPTRSELALACDDRRVRFIDATNGGPTREDLLTMPPRDVQWSPDGERLLVTGAKGRAAFHVEHLAVQQLAQGARMRTEVFHHGDITSGSFSPDGALVLTSSMDGTIFVRDVRDGSPIVHLRGDGAAALHASFSSGPGPLRVIGAFADGSARVWPVDPLPGAKLRKPRELSEWETAREERLALPLKYR